MEFQIRIPDTRSSTVISGEPAWYALSMLAGEHAGKNHKSFILADDNTEKFCLPLLFERIPQLKGSAILTIHAGEKSKTAETAFTLWNKLALAEAERNSLFINLGGGVVSDLGGFVASTFKRGMPFINIPTTLMAMADASIGGKTAINLGDVKNQVGTFSLPVATFIFTGFLKTLDNAQLRSGLAEIIKIALVSDLSFWEYLDSSGVMATCRNSPEKVYWESLVESSVAAKCLIVNRDFFERNERALLNFGHTFGHAFETFANQQKSGALSHGHAISLGILCEAFLSKLKCGLSQEDLDRITKMILYIFEYFPVGENDLTRMNKLMNQDKKRSKGMPRFTLLESPGKAVISQVCREEEIEAAFAFYRSLDPQR